MSLAGRQSLLTQSVHLLLISLINRYLIPLLVNGSKRLLELWLLLANLKAIQSPTTLMTGGPIDVLHLRALVNQMPFSRPVVWISCVYLKHGCLLVTRVFFYFCHLVSTISTLHWLWVEEEKYHDKESISPNISSYRPWASQALNSVYSRCVTEQTQWIERENSLPVWLNWSLNMSVFSQWGTKPKGTLYSFYL